MKTCCAVRLPRRGWMLFTPLLLLACASAPAPVAAPPEVAWSGTVEVKETLRFPRGTHLTLAPGTVVRFSPADADGDGWGDVSLILEGGELTARGTPEAPILFTSANPLPQPGSWGELRLDFSRLELTHTAIEGSTRGLHLHFTRGSVADSVLRDNVDGTRLGECRVAFTRCLFTRQASKGFNARASTNTVEASWFRGNRYGVFLFEGDEGSRLAGNRFTDNATPFRLGDFYNGTVDASGNEWDRPPTDFRSEGSEDARLVAEPAPAGDVGPRGWPVLQTAWTRKTEGFADADPAVDDLGVFSADWSGNLSRLGFLAGDALSAARLGDTVDAGPALGRAGGRWLLAVSSWDRALTLLDAATLAELDRFVEAPSPADDHRQAAPVFDGTRLYAASWAGRVRAFDVSAGKLAPLWTFEAHGPCRAPPLVVDGPGGRLVLVPCEDKTLYALDAATGRMVWTFAAEGPLVSGLAQREGVVYAGDRSGTLTALSAATGKPLWRANHAAPLWHAPPQVFGSLVLQADDAGLLVARDAVNGVERWRVQLSGPVRSRPALVSQDLAAVADLSGTLTLVRAADGFVWDRLGLGGPLHASPAVLGERLFLGGRDGAFRAVDVRHAGN